MREARAMGAFAAVGAVLMALFCLGPFLYMALVGVAERHDFLSPASDFAPTTAHFREALGNPGLHVPALLRNSLVVAAACAAAAPALGALAAYPLTRMPLPGRRAILLIALCLTMFPPISLAGHLYRMMWALGWLNTLPALILPYTAWLLPFSIWFLAGYLAQVPRELDQAAAVDGCGPFGVFRRVLLPLSAPGLLSTALLAFLFAYNEFLFALLLTVDHRSRTVPVGLALFQGTHGETPWGLIMAVSLLCALPAAALALVFQKRIVGGLTRGAVKG